MASITDNGLSCSALLFGVSCLVVIYVIGIVLVLVLVVICSNDLDRRDAYRFRTSHATTDDTPSRPVGVIRNKDHR